MQPIRHTCANDFSTKASQVKMMCRRTALDSTQCLTNHQLR